MYTYCTCIYCTCILCTLLYTHINMQYAISTIPHVYYVLKNIHRCMYVRSTLMYILTWYSISIHTDVHSCTHTLMYTHQRIYTDVGFHALICTCIYTLMYIHWCILMYMWCICWCQLSGHCMHYAPIYTVTGEPVVPGNRIREGIDIIFWHAA